MLVEIAARLRFVPLETYRYISLGSIAFVDCRAFHRAFGITDIVSIEGSRGDNIKTRLEQNKPFRCVDLRFGMSWDVLPSLEFDRPSIVWLDYDDQLQRSMVNDLTTVARTISPGSFLIVTYATSYPAPGVDRGAVLAKLKGDFPDFLAHDENEYRFEKSGLARFGRQVLGELLSKALADADAGSAAETHRRAEQVCFFRYRDGAWMCTVGWVIVTDESRPQFDAGAFGSLSFVRSTDEPVVIKVPLVTPHEVRELERHLPENIEDEDISWIPSADRSAFHDYYRYLPNLAVVEPV